MFPHVRKNNFLNSDKCFRFNSRTNGRRRSKMAMTVSKVIQNNITTNTNYIVSNSFPFHQVHFIESEGGRSESRRRRRKCGSS